MTLNGENILDFKLTKPEWGYFECVINLDTIDDDEPVMEMEFYPDKSNSDEYHFDINDWDTINQYLWDYQSEGGVFKIGELILEIYN